MMEGPTQWERQRHCQTSSGWSLIVQSPFGAKHHVVVQYMAAEPKCPRPPMEPPLARPPQPNPPPHGQTLTHGPPLPPDLRGRQGGQGRIDDITGKGLRTAVALSTASCLIGSRLQTQGRGPELFLQSSLALSV